MLGEAPEPAIALDVPVRQVGTTSKEGHLVEEAATQTAGIYLLQANQIVVRKHGTDALEVEWSTRIMHHLPPAAGDVLMITLGRNAGLDVE